MEEAQLKLSQIHITSPARTKGYNQSNVSTPDIFGMKSSKTPLKPMDGEEDDEGPPKMRSLTMASGSEKKRTQLSGQKKSQNAKPQWDGSFAKKISDSTPKRVTTADVRMRKQSTVAVNSSNQQSSVRVSHSPRTPHVSQTNAKKQKNMGQLARPVLSTKFAHVSAQVTQDGFAVPKLPTTHHQPSFTSSNKENANSITSATLNSSKELKLQLQKEIALRQEFEQKYLREKKDRIKAELECSNLEEKVFQLESRLRTLGATDNASILNNTHQQVVVNKLTDKLDDMLSSIFDTKSNQDNDVPMDETTHKESLKAKESAIMNKNGKAKISKKRKLSKKQIEQAASRAARMESKVQKSDEKRAKRYQARGDY
ncbi:hypothetical protein MIR68_004047 [Amoeboaphelidium protococcarum]|nr:hypothetical protein MIR68_004047 [Amoeboaphelidium protococcarum]